MPKIPTFKAQGTITGEAPTSAIGVQAPLSMAKTFEPVQKAVADYAVKEKLIQDKTEALRLENDSIIELNTAVQEASKMINKEQANNYLKTESLRIQNKYADQASSSSVKRLFNNNYLIEEQKQIYKVDNAVYQNIVQDYANQKSRKYESIITEGLYGKNPLQEEQLINDLTKLENEDLTQDEDTRRNNIAMIPNKIAYFKAKRDAINDPVETYRLISTNDEKYKDLNLSTRESVLKELKLEASQVLQEDMTNYLVGIENGIEVPINKEAIKEIFGNKSYTDFLETEQNTIKVGEYKSLIMNSKIGEENSILESFELRPDNLAEDLKYKQKVANFLADKNELVENDAAKLIIQFNSTVRSQYEEYQNEPEGENKDKLFKKYVNSVIQSQQDMDIDPSLVKVIPESFAKDLVRDYESQDPRNKIDYLRGLEEKYGDQYGVLLNQLSANELPITAKLISYLGDENIATQMISIDTKEEKKILDDFVKQADLDKNSIEREVFDAMKDLRDVVMYSNKMNTTRANKEMNDIQEIITYVAINKMSSQNKIDQKAAIKEAASYVMSKFKFAGGESGYGGDDTYFIPKIYNNETLSDGQIRLIELKARTIKEKHLDDFDMFAFQSTNPEIDDKELNEEMLNQAKENGVWVNNADGSGIVFAIPFADGSLALVENKKGELLEMKFDDGSHELPTTNILLDLKIYETNKIEDAAG